MNSKWNGISKTQLTTLSSTPKPLSSYAYLTWNQYKTKQNKIFKYKNKNKNKNKKQKRKTKQGRNKNNTKTTNKQTKTKNKKTKKNKQKLLTLLLLLLLLLLLFYYYYYYYYFIIITIIIIIYHIWTRVSEVWIITAMRKRAREKKIMLSVLSLFLCRGTSTGRSEIAISTSSIYFLATTTFKTGLKVIL